MPGTNKKEKGEAKEKKTEVPLPHPGLCRPSMQTMICANDRPNFTSRGRPTSCTTAVGDLSICPDSSWPSPRRLLTSPWPRRPMPAAGLAWHTSCFAVASFRKGDRWPDGPPVELRPPDMVMGIRALFGTIGCSRGFSRCLGRYERSNTYTDQSARGQTVEFPWFPVRTFASLPLAPGRQAVFRIRPIVRRFGAVSFHDAVVACFTSRAIPSNATRQRVSGVCPR